MHSVAIEPSERSIGGFFKKEIFIKNVPAASLDDGPSPGRLREWLSERHVVSAQLLPPAHRQRVRPPPRHVAAARLCTTAAAAAQPLVRVFQGCQERRVESTQ